MKKRVSLVLSILLFIVSLVGCTKNKANESQNDSSQKETIITVAAAASLKNCMEDKLIPMFQEKYPNIKVQGTYDSSGKLQFQIQEGADIDVFMSAAIKQMKELNEKGLISENSIVELLENKVVLITPKENDKGIKTFEDIVKSDKIAIGDPASVPAGQYAKELFENLKLWEVVSSKASLGTNVTEVLTWVAEGSADAGVVYSTDAASNNKVEVVAEAKEGTVAKVIYPIGIIKSTKNNDSAKAFTDFLQSDEVIKVFETYGFTSNK